MQQHMPVVVIGIGNRYRGDDDAGLAVIRSLRTSILPQGVRLVEGVKDGMELLEYWDERACVMLVDAMVSGAVPGTIACFDALRDPLPADLSFRSTHALGVAEALLLGQALQRLPQLLFLYGIEGHAYQQREGMSSEVERAVAVVVEMVMMRIGTITTPEGKIYATDTTC